MVAHTHRTTVPKEKYGILRNRATVTFPESAVDVKMKLLTVSHAGTVRHGGFYATASLLHKLLFGTVSVEVFMVSCPLASSDYYRLHAIIFLARFQKTYIPQNTMRFSI